MQGGRMSLSVLGSGREADSSPVSIASLQGAPPTPESVLGRGVLV